MKLISLIKEWPGLLLVQLRKISRKDDVLKCAHCGKDITSSYYRIYIDQDGSKYYYHSDSILGKNCIDVVDDSDKKKFQYPSLPEPAILKR